MRFWLPLLLVSILGTNASAEWACVKYRKVNVREAPRMNSRVLRKDIQFTTYEVIDYYGDWAQVMSIDGQTGWIHGTALTHQPAGVVSSDSAVVLDDAHPDGVPLRRVSRGHPFRITGKLGRWLRVEDSRGSGWMEAKSLWGNLDFTSWEVHSIL